MKGYLPLIWKDSLTHMHGLVVYEKEGLPFSRDLSLENSADSSYVFNWLHLTYAWFLMLFHLKQIMFSPSTHLLMCLSLETSMYIKRTNWTYSGGTDRTGEICYNFFVSSDLTQMVSFPTHILDCDSHNHVLSDLFISSDTSICSRMAFLSLENSDHVVLSHSPLTFCQTENGMPCFIL